MKGTKPTNTCMGPCSGHLAWEPSREKVRLPRDYTVLYWARGKKVRYEMGSWSSATGLLFISRRKWPSWVRLEPGIPWLPQLLPNWSSE